MDPRVARSRAALRAALLVVVERGDEVTVKGLCAQSDLTRGTFYLHYGDIGDVVADTVRTLVSDIAEPWSELDTQDADAFGVASIRFIADYLRHVAEQRAFYAWVLRTPGFTGAVQAILEGYAAAIVEGLRRTAATPGDDKRDADADADAASPWIADFLAGAMFGVVARWALSRPTVDAEQLALWLWTELTVHPVNRVPGAGGGEV